MGLLEKRRKIWAIKRAAKKFGLDWRLVASIVYVESKGQRKAKRYEPGFYTRYLENKTKKQLMGHWPTVISQDTERRDRAYSYGPMQVMGQTAREHGYEGDYFSDLTESFYIGCLMGCRILKAKISNNQGDIRKGVKAYNGVGEAAEAYMRKVFQIMDSKTYLRI